MRKFLSKYGGIILGSIYGLIMRIFFDTGHRASVYDITDLFSVTFVWIVPILIGITPLIFATKEQLRKESYRIGSPVLTVFLFFCFCLMTRLEEIICLIILSIPFLFGAAIAGVILGELILRYRKRKGIMYSFLLIPFLTGIVEEQFPTPTETFAVQTKIIVNSTSNNIWGNIIRVKEIDKNDYSKGFFNYAGIPRPLFAELDKDTIGATRIGHFEGGLMFKETVTKWERNKAISFDIKVITGSIRNTIFDQHILKGNQFRFLDASYELRQVSEKQIELTLSSTYRLNSKINYYGNFWGDILITDFQKRLLLVVKKRCEEKQNGY